ncbi:hypothetical protein LUZ62_043843 [Rhynchospora pubera]|uniref:N-alpha-acetyltransferase 35, NatC auxiliary subunit n=1 Tax=Rhynchospora pubera TaxID=906938 RepID=A0AAV8FNQ6_9POAL|nr:hypothetical protein LUZ62_043843 [Rhynchospora pubera]
MATNHSGVQGEVDASSSPPHFISPGDGCVWADASSLIDAACNDLQEGDLVHGENFSLFAAMSALEIMDPKMDSGIENGYCTVEEAIEAGAAPVPLSFDRTVDVQRTIDVMDHLFSCEATWHKGSILAQTVFSCIYLLRLERTSPHPILNAYCRIMHATCNEIIKSVSNARTHEEEDLFVMAYGLPLKDEDNERLHAFLHSVEETISRKLRACKAQPSSKKKQVEDVEPLQTNPELEEGYCRALLCRLRFRKYFDLTLRHIRNWQGKGQSMAHKYIITCLAELDNMRKNENFLKSQPHISCKDSPETSTTASGCKAIGFDATLNAKSLSPAPPRAAKIISWHDARVYFEKLLHDLDILCSFSFDPMLENILHFVVQFQKSKPDLVARAYLQLLLIQSGKLYGREFFHEVIARVLLLPDVAKDKAFHQNEFVVQLGQLLMVLLKILCTNSAWQRRKLGKTLQDWSVVSIQLELAYNREFGEAQNSSADEGLHAKVSKRLFLWAQEQTYWIASRFLQLGFELELYSPWEYCMVYWYMSVVFVQLLEKIQLRSIANIDTTRQKGKKKRDNHAKDHSRDAIFSPSCLLLQCHVYLCEGLAMILAALRNEGSAFKMPNTFNSEHERFIQHFELLLRAHLPEQISFSSFHESILHARVSDVVRCDYFKEIQRITTSLKGSFAEVPEKLSEIRQIEQVAERNRIALNIINQLGASDTSLRVSFELTHHPYFAVVVVKRS